MSYDTKPRPRPKTVADWREVRRQQYKNAGSKGGFRLLPAKVLDSDAFNDLSKSSKLVLILSLRQIDYWHKKYKHTPRRETSIGPLRDDGCFSLPSNLLKERGIGSSQTITKARKELVAAGFWEVIETGTLYNSGVFRWSDNWLTYNQKSPAERKSIDPSSKATGYCHYPNITRYNDQIKAAKASHPGSSLFWEEEHDSQGNEYLQLELFKDLSD